jgi:hypothetical protein
MGKTEEWREKGLTCRCMIISIWARLMNISSGLQSITQEKGG